MLFVNKLGGKDENKKSVVCWQFVAKVRVRFCAAAVDTRFLAVIGGEMDGEVMMVIIGGDWWWWLLVVMIVMRLIIVGDLEMVVVWPN